MDKASELENKKKPRIVRRIRPDMQGDLPTTISRFLILLIIMLLLMLARHMILGQIDAPRTSLERDIMRYTAQLQVDPDDAIARAGLGAAYMKMGQSEEALREFKHAIRLKPKKAQYRYNIAVAYWSLGSNTEALKQLKVAKGSARDWDAPFFLGGQIHLERQEYTEAVRDLEVALDMNPANADAHYTIAQAYEGLDETTSAAKSYRQVLKYVPNYAGVRAALSKLESTSTP